MKRRDFLTATAKSVFVGSGLMIGGGCTSSSPPQIASESPRPPFRTDRIEQDAIERSLIGFQGRTRERLLSIVGTETGFDGVISGGDAQNLVNETGVPMEDLMRDLLPLAAVYARPPISDFKVGAVALGKSGALYLGANMEFEGQALSASVHAEQSAVTNAWLHNEEGIVDLAVNYAPCGYCRQFLNELITARDLRIFLPRRAARNLTELLPDHFGPRDLGLEGGLMKADFHNVQPPPHAIQDEVIKAAVDAAGRSYAPYSKNYSGVAVETRTGRIYRGRYAENAAFNPSILPLQVALSNLNLSGELFQDIRRAVLVEVTGRDVRTSLVADTRNLLKTVAASELEVVYIRAD